MLSRKCLESHQYLTTIVYLCLVNWLLVISSYQPRLISPGFFAGIETRERLLGFPPEPNSHYNFGKISASKCPGTLDKAKFCPWIPNSL